MSRRIAALAALVAASVGAGSARGGEAPASAPARLIYRRCAGDARSLDQTAFVRLLGIELAADGVTEVTTVGLADPLPRPPGGAALAVLSLEGACGEGAGITIEIDDAATDKSVRRAVDLSDLPPGARARALSLATAELLRASWAELVMPGAPPPRAPVPSAIRAATVARLTPRAAPPMQRALDRSAIVLGAGFDARFFFGSGLGMMGGRLSASIPLPARGFLGVRLDAGAVRGTATAPIGEAELWLVSGGVGLRAGVGTPEAWIEAGPRLELGWGHAEGHATGAGIQTHQGAALVAIASLVAAGRIRLGWRVWSTLELEIGPVLKGFTPTADERALGAVSSVMGAARLGLALPL